MSKVQLITDKLREMISSEEFADKKLPGERELAVQFDCGRNTIRAVLAHLAKEGWINRCRKKGTIVTKSTQNNKCLAGLVMPAGGHFYEDLYNELLTGFVEHGYSVQSISTNPIVDNDYSVSSRRRMSIKNAIGKLLDLKPDIIVLHGYNRHEVPYFRELCQYRNTVMVDWLLGSSDLKMPGVWLGYEKAGYMAGRYMMEQGCRKPVLFPNYISLEHRLNFDIYAHHKEKMLADGFRRAVQEYGGNPETAVVESFSFSLKEYLQLFDRLSVMDVADGFCSTDVNVISFMKKLLENRGCIPENMHFIGLFNTPWSSNKSFFPFTSIDFNVASVVKAVLETAELSPEKRRDIYIEPKLVIREKYNKKLNFNY